MAELTDIAALGSFLKGLGALEEDGKFTELGKELLAHQLEHWLPDRHGPAFDAIKRAAGAPFAPVECVPIFNGQVLLRWREHPLLGKGWHTAGTYPDAKKREPMIDAVRRCAFTELGLKVKVLAPIGFRDHFYNPRFPDVPILFLCSIVGDLPEPKVDCQWFTKCPSDMLPIQEDYRDLIDEAIKTSGL